MKITRRDLGVIMILAGILIVFMVYKMSFEPTQGEIEQLQNEQKELQGKIDELQPYVEKAPTYEKRIKQIQAKVDDILEEFPDDIWQEDNIMYVNQMIEDLNVKLPSFSASPAKVINTINGEGALAEKTIQLLSAGVNFSYTVKDYDEMKTLLKYVYDDKENTRTINNVSLSFDKQTGKISGGIAIIEYAMTDDISKYEEADLPLEDIGIENECVFGETEEAKENKE